MKRLRPLCVAAFALFISAAWMSADSARAQEQKQEKKAALDQPVRLLFVTYSGGFKHGAVTRKNDKLAPSEVAMTDLGIKSGLFRADCTQDPAKDLTKDNLQNYRHRDVLHDRPRERIPVDEDDMQYFLNDWLKKKGHGFIGAHSAADTMADYKPYWDMIGGSFNGHPWNAGEKVTVTVHDTQHPISKPWGEEFEIQDEIYQLQELAAGEGPRADEPEHGQDQAQEAVSRADRLVQGVRRWQGVSHESWPQRPGLGEREVHAIDARAASSGSSVWRRVTRRRTPICRRRRRRKPRPTPRLPNPRGSGRLHWYTASVSIHERD